MSQLAGLVNVPLALAIQKISIFDIAAGRLVSKTHPILSNN